MTDSAETPKTAPQSNPKIGPIIDDIRARDLHTEESYEVETSDGWTIVITRLQPIPQEWHQPLLGEPIVCVHGFSQNRYAWTTGEFAKNMLYFGADIHILELRGHGRSSRALQREKCADEGKPLPPTFDYDWSLDEYFLYDIPAAIEAIKKRTNKSSVFYCGHSMGGMLGYGIASIRDDIAGLTTIGSPLELGKESLLIRTAAKAGFLIPALQGGFRIFNNSRTLQYSAIHSAARKMRELPIMSAAAKQALQLEQPKELRPNVVRMDLFLQMIYNYMRATDQEGFWIPKPMRIFNPKKHASADLEWILTQGGEKEPINVLRQFIRWINRGEMKCYANNYDFQENAVNIKIPVTIIFGDEDFLAGVKSTRLIYESVASDYVVWRPVRGNSHLEITMGSDIRQICYDIKNMMEYTIVHRTRRSRLPRLRKKKEAQA